VAFPNPDDFEPDGTWYSMVAVHDKLYAVEPNHGEVDRISPNGQIHRIIDVSATQGHIVPTALAHDDGRFALGNLGVFPSPIGNAVLFQFPMSGKLRLEKIGFPRFLESLSTPLTAFTCSRRATATQLAGSQSQAPAT